MSATAFFVMLGITLLFIILGVLLKYFDFYWLIAGYNTMSAEQKKNVDAKGLARFLGNCLFLIAGIHFMGTVFNYFGYPLVYTLSMSSLFLIIPYILIKAQSFDKNTKTESERTKTGLKLSIGFIILILLMVGSLMIYGSMDSEVQVTGDTIEIEGMYGISLNHSQIEDITLLAELPAIRKKVNGFNLGHILKGDFDLEKLGEGTLFVQKEKPPYIHIKLKEGYVILNSKDPDLTEELYKTINTSWSE